MKKMKLGLCICGYAGTITEIPALNQMPQNAMSKRAKENNMLAKEQGEWIRLRYFILCL
jgi:hypothetical protein